MSPDDAQHVQQRAGEEIPRADRLLEVAHVAHRLRVSPQYVRRVCRTRQLVAARIGKRWRIHPSDLDRYIASRMADVPPRD